ncbi:sulfatase-like hydrolase/transferase [Verrucomicrobiales bacterium]|nr:sulfatase-like hydrolase/transferase [Verrucomicrobiales bacterium]
MKKYNWSVLLGVLSGVTFSVSSFGAERPNIIVIMADDLGYNDVGCYGCKDIPTPHIDSLAKEGVRFASGYVTWPMCGPSRAGFLTGKHQSKFGYYKNVSAPFNPAQGLPKMETIASLLQKQGYVTGGVGKWHMGTTDDQHPNAMGFDDWFGFLGGGLMYFPLDHPSYKGRFTPPIKRPMNHKYLQHTLPVIHNREPVEWDQYLTRELTDAGIRFLEKNQESPFFLFMSYNAPHLDLEAPEETIAKFPADKMTVVPGVKPGARSVYGAMVFEMDEGIGQLLARVDELELSKKTVVWFLSDHGGMKATSDNRPLRGCKGRVYEGGLRVPMIVKWPGKIPHGLVLGDMVTSLDIGATSIAMAGGDPEKAGLHGKDIRPYVTQQSPDAPHEVLFWHTGSNANLAGVIREGDFKLISGGRGNPELYNLKDDLGETTNLAASYPEKVEAMRARWLEWDKDKQPPLWTGGENIQHADYDWLKGSLHYKAKSE